MDASCTIQDSIHVFSLVHKYVSSILGTYQEGAGIALFGIFFTMYYFAAFAFLAFFSSK